MRGVHHHHIRRKPNRERLSSHALGYLCYHKNCLKRNSQLVRIEEMFSPYRPSNIEDSNQTVYWTAWSHLRKWSKDRAARRAHLLIRLSTTAVNNSSNRIKIISRTVTGCSWALGVHSTHLKPVRKRVWANQTRQRLRKPPRQRSLLTNKRCSVWKGSCFWLMTLI